MVNAEKNSGQVSDSGAGDKVQIQIRCPSGSKFAVRTELESTVGEFKALLAQNCEIPANQQRLIYKGRILKDDETLDSYGLQEEHAVHLVRRFLPDASTNAATATTPDPVGPNTTPGVAQGVGANESGGLGGSLESFLFPGLDAHGLGGSGAYGSFEVHSPQLEQLRDQLSQTLDVLTEVRNLPGFQNLFNNPDMIHDIMMSDPLQDIDDQDMMTEVLNLPMNGGLLRDIVDHNPELAHILNDPSTMQQTLEIARNPELMREMMRNTDRAMSNIESSPEGFNMLRRMYENVQEPLLNATSMAGDSGNVMASNPLAALFGGQGRGQVQDQSTTPASTGSDTTTGSAAPNSNPLPNPWSQTGANGGAQGNASTRLNPQRFPFFQLSQNPDVTQRVQSVFSNPQNMNQMLDESTEDRHNPETMQQVPTLMQLLSSIPGQQQSPQGLDQTGGGTRTPNNMRLDFSMNMFSGLSGSPTVPNTANVPLEELYVAQLTQLQEMGFIDTGANIQALRATSGNVHAAVERLLGNSGQ